MEQVTNITQDPSINAELVASLADNFNLISAEMDEIISSIENTNEYEKSHELLLEEIKQVQEFDIDNYDKLENRFRKLSQYLKRTIRRRDRSRK